MVRRLNFVDWLKGLFVIWMVPTHVFDGVFPGTLKSTSLYHSVAFFNGLVAPAFLISSGFLALYTYNDNKFYARLRRGLELMAFGYATQLPFGSLIKTAEYIYLYVVGNSPQFFERSINIFQRVEILICIGSGAIAITLILRFFKTVLHRFLLFFTLALLFWFAAPFMNEAGKAFPPFISPYFTFKNSLFPIFPYWGYMFFGSALALLYAERKKLFFILTLIPIFFVFLRVFWNIPSEEAFVPYILLKVGVLFLIIYILEFAENIGYSFRFLSLLGRNSLLSYAFHNIIVYGSPFTKPLKYYYGYQTWMGGMILGLFTLVLTSVFLYSWDMLRSRYGPKPARFAWKFLAITYVLSPW